MRTSSALVVVDRGRTCALVAPGESNPLLGHHPSHGAVNRYMIGVLAANALVSRIHGPEWRHVISALVVGAELATVYRNQRVSVGWQFRW